MSDTVDCRYHGRGFSAGEMALMRALIAGPPARNRSQLATEFCRQTGWVKPDGGLKTMMAKVTMLKMHRDGVITLPPARPARKKTRVITFGPETEPPSSPAPVTLDAVRPIHLVRITGAGRKASRLWNEFIARYHYLGYKTLVGAQMRYAVHDRDGRPLAMLGFSTAAWKTAPRDAFIGWSPQTREKNLPLMIDNSRFLILPWIRIPNLASHILSVIRKQLPNDWARQYKITPVLIETFVEIPRFTGTTYRASGWVRAGTTKGRGRYDTKKEYAQPKKDIWLCPLRKDWKKTLNR